MKINVISDLIITPSSNGYAILVFSTRTKGQVTVKIRMAIFEKRTTNLVHPWLAAHAWKALRTTSTIRCEVNTFPPHTAAVLDGDRRDFLGILTVTAHVNKQTVDSKEHTLDRNQTASVERNVDIQHCTHAINHSRMHH